MNRRLFLQAGTAGLLEAQPSPEKTYRVVLIGDTGHGGYGHGWELAWRNLPNTRVTAVADPDDSGRQRAMAASGATVGYRNYSEMLEKEKPDIVTICPRWPDQRLAMLTAAADCGAHVLMEKPFASSLEEADAMISVAERRGVKVQVGHTARPLPVTIRVRELLRSGELGTLLEIRARGKEDRRAGGEDLIVLGTHDFDLMRYFAGDPQSVFAEVTERGRPARKGRKATEPIGPVAGDEIAAMFTFGGGLHGYFASKASDVTTGRRFGVTLCGSKAIAYVPLTAVPGAAPYLLRNAAWVGEGKPDVWERIQHPHEAGPTTRDQTNALMAADLLRAIEQNRDPVCSARDGRWTIEMVAGIYQSGLSGRPVSFPLADRHSPLREA